jgi:hypothetical protein
MSGGKTSGKKRKVNHIAGSKNQTSRFVLCPAGCGKHILPHEMNKHLDACLLRQSVKDHPVEQKTPKSALCIANEGREKVDQNAECIPSTIPSTSMEGTTPKSVPSYTDKSPIETPGETDKIGEMGKRDDEKPTLDTTNERTTENRNTHQQNNVFAHMMKRSVTVFSEQETFSASSPKLFQRMHLHANGSVTLKCYANDRTISPEEKISWSATIQVRGKKDGATPPIDLLVSSSIPSATSISSSTPDEPQRIRLVRNHSRLSVPVLKSILQKGIRRRKPLPSVRVASELADKSLGDLLRRLPIIILEDSTLHPSLPFLVWLMMAVSKDYQPPISLMKRILGIVFEMASCRWKDSLRARNRQPDSDNTGIEEKREYLTLVSLHRATIGSVKDDEIDQRKQNRTAVLLNNDELIVWSILMRGQYGGMTGDIQMLQGYAELWHERFDSTQGLPDDVKKRLSPIISDSSNNITTNSKSASTVDFGIVAGHEGRGDNQNLEEWNQVPQYIHQSAAKNSAARIDRLLLARPMVSPSQSQPMTSMQSKNQQPTEDHSFVGLPCLSKSDVSPEGVDFHCSSVLESAVFSDAKLVRECFARLAGMETNRRHRSPAAGEDGRSWLGGLLKSFMWKYSGGVNFRLPLIAKGEEGNYNDAELKRFYETIIRPRVEAFSNRYIEERLTKR